MKGRSTFHIFLLLVVLLTFSSHSAFGIRPRPTKPKVERKQNPIELQAKQDAKNDVNKFAWFTAGLIGCASSRAMIELISLPDNSLGLSLGLLVVVVPTFSPIVSAASASSAPPPERLLGKSSEYVNAYVDSYRKEVKRQRVISSAAGCGVSLLAIGVMNIQVIQ